MWNETNVDKKASACSHGDAELLCNGAVFTSPVVWVIGRCNIGP